MLKPNTGIAEALIVWVISYIFFLLSLVNNFSASHDSINYLHHIVRGEHLFHQHHLLYHFFANRWLAFLQPFLTNVPPHYIVESFTALWGSALLAICFIFLRHRFALSRQLSSAGILIIAFAYGIWFYSVNVEVYAPPTFLIIAALYILTKKTPGERDVLLIALLHSGAMLFHQVNVLFALVVLVWLFSNRLYIKPAKSLAVYTLITVLVTGGVYLAIGWVVEGNDSVAAYSQWLLGYAVGHDYWQPLSLKTPLKALTGFCRAFIGGQFIFQVPPIKRFLESSFKAHSLQDEFFLSRSVPGTLAWVFAMLSMIFGLLISLLAARFVRQFRKMKLEMHVIIPLLTTLVVYSIFFLFWMPEILEFWILQMVIVCLLLIGKLPLIHFPFGISNIKGLLLLAMLLFAVNYFGSIRWLKSLEYDWYYHEVKRLESGPNDLVIVEDEWILKDYVRHFTNSALIATDEHQFTTEQIRGKVRDVASKGGKAFLYKKTNGDTRWVIIQSY